MIQLSETIEGLLWSVVDTKLFKHDGCVVDVGCLRWNWSKTFLGRKRVIGIDPIEKECPTGAELFSGLLGPYDSSVTLNICDDSTKIDTNTDGEQFNYNMISWKTFCKNYNIDKVSILKINIEGSEYPLLHSMDSDDFDKIDQIVISFHDWLNPNWKHLTSSSLFLLKENGFTILQTFDKFGWYLAIKN
jgi:hypothetical protein